MLLQKLHVTYNLDSLDSLIRYDLLEFNVFKNYLGRLSNPHHDSPFSIFVSSSNISSSLWPHSFTTSQKLRNSSNEITPSLFTSTVLKNSLAEIFPNAFFQWLSASSLSISCEPSTSNMWKTSSTFFLHSGESSWNKINLKSYFYRAYLSGFLVSHDLLF